MGGFLLEKVRNTVRTNMQKQKHCFGAELGLRGSVWGSGGPEMIARLLGSLWKPSWDPKLLLYKNNKSQKKQKEATIQFNCLPGNRTVTFNCLPGNLKKEKLPSWQSNSNVENNSRGFH